MKVVSQVVKFISKVSFIRCIFDFVIARCIHISNAVFLIVKVVDLKMIGKELPFIHFQKMKHFFKNGLCK